ncbi:MAG TPA: tetraacyldisaccharide 4'-kinase [Ignavibacteria bacterium]|nr:tetraacyldisaccharide 4'-kinase [Ignavibacteria bacterium]HMQ99002.1 tetraacyldisaccharide 4'-kinase [Ignavibacteria bacterium]
MKIFLIPISLLFRLGVFFRNFFYNSGIIKAKVLEPKIISVGNISAGGTGKTPFVELITEYLLKKKKFAVIVSKGYKREFDDIKVVETGFRNEKHELNTENLGDEALMLLENLSDSGLEGGLLVVGDDKTKAAKFAASKFKPEIIIIDDGFQHRKLFRDLDIVILNPDSDKHMIPAGKLREPLKNYRRADLLVINNKFEKNPVNENRKNMPQVICNYVFEGIRGIDNTVLPVEDIKSATVYCGIGEPDSFKLLLNELNIKIDEFIVFPDHHYFTNTELENLMNSFSKNGSSHILTTQKDYVRLKNSELVLKAKSNNTYKNLLFNFPLYFTKIKMQINSNSEYLFKEIDNLLKSE